LGGELGLERMAAQSFFMNSGRALAGDAGLPRSNAVDPYIDIEDFMERLQEKGDLYIDQLDR
jgi:hypothetical protein